ncbi:MAG: diguanylate cyclase [Butyrivibrio sp.]|nr:diguanylate cyclase [Butyrivibrio sp.]
MSRIKRYYVEIDKAEGYYDEMTGLLSKSAITDHAKRLMEQTNTPPFYFFLMDIDNFKSINDTYGHMKGDAESYQEYSYHGSYGGVPSK